MALMTGTTIGAGVLALPSVTYTSGFIPSTMAFGYGCTIMYHLTTGRVHPKVTGVTILFLVLPSYIVWNLRYNDVNSDKTTTTTTTTTTTNRNNNDNTNPTNNIDTSHTRPTSHQPTTSMLQLVPGGRIPMIGLWITAIGLMADQIFEKLNLNFIPPT